MESAINFQKSTFGKRLKTMLRVDFKRMFRSKLFYIMLAWAFVIPILMNIMMTMMDGSVSVNPQSGAETVIQGPENTWQSIGTLPTGEDAVIGGMDVMSLCNINMMFMLVTVFICLFVSEDFRSGYVKNLFTARAKKGDYVLSKSLAGFVCGALMLIFYFIGTTVGGMISGLSFSFWGFTAGNLVMCMLSKIFLMPVFIAIFVLISISAKQKAWLALCGSLGGGMLLFTMVPMITPLGSTMINVILCLAGGILFSAGLGVCSCKLLEKTSLV